MTTLIGDDLIDLVLSVDDTEIWNDVRVMVPSYTYTLELLDDGWHKYPVDVVQRNVDSASINKYGRRTKTQKWQVIEQYFAEAYCSGQVLKYKEPMDRAKIKMVGANDANILTGLTARLGQTMTCQVAALDMNHIGYVDHFTLDVDADNIMRIGMNIEELRPLEALYLFHVGIDTVDNAAHVIG